MAYSNVGTCVFYIDNYLYQKTIGISEPLDGGDLYITPDENPELFTMNPIFTTELSSDKLAYIPLPNSIDKYDFSGNMKYYTAILNHNANGASSMSWYQYLPEIDDHILDISEVLNAQGVGASFMPNSGSTIITTSQNLSSEATTLNFNNDISVGAISTGVQYTMPYSPDLKLSMEIEMEGTNTITTSGGASLSNIQYTGNPLWVNGDSQTNPFEVYNNTLDARQVGARRNGRKSWSLKFSYLSDTDLFSSNPKASSYTEHPADSTYSNSDLASGSQVSDGSLAHNIDSDDSFVAQVWNKAGLGIPFIFQPNSNDRDDFYICRFDQDSLKVSQSAFKVYDVSLKIVEAW